MPDVAERYRDNLARSLIGIARDVQARVHEGLVARGHGGLRPSFGPLLSTVREEGRTLSAVAAELGVSGQAASQLVNAAEAAGYLTRRQNPGDGRSKLVAPTPRGRMLIEDGIALIVATERDYRERIGASAYRRFSEALALLHAGIVRADRAAREPAHRSIGVLPEIALTIERELMAAARKRGHRGLKMVFAQVIPQIGPDGARVHQIAREQRVSRQAISAIVRELVALGYLERHADPSDGRGVVYALSEAGEALVRDSVLAFDAMEGRFRRVLGAERLADLERTGGRLFRALNLEAEVFAGSPEGAAEPDVRALASRLRNRLGPGQTERLAAFLGAREKEKGS